MMIVVSEEDPTEENDDTEPDYTPAEHSSEPDYSPADHFSLDPSKPLYSPVYTLAGLEFLSSNYELDEDKEYNATSLEILPPRPTLSHRYFRAYTTGTWVKQTPRKTIVIPYRKRAGSPPASPPPSKKP
ncbi:unnamed protein product [Lactuca virosa]|uniref:Uncharacterized protein n=1 Tax=Lactuca virosa TaxID=75947 RepID=A0AAU9NFI4_9ASTR|nr:unnamed protein product [Lactuca virosa]